MMKTWVFEWEQLSTQLLHCMQFNVTLTSKDKCHSPPFVLALCSFTFACTFSMQTLKHRLVNLVQSTFTLQDLAVWPRLCLCSVICIIREQIAAIGSKVTHALVLLDLRPCLPSQSSCSFSKPVQGTVSQDFFFQSHHLTDTQDSWSYPGWYLLLKIFIC